MELQLALRQLHEVDAINKSINLELQHPNYSKFHHPLSLQLVKTASRFNKPYLFIALKTHLRYSDVYEFDLKSAVKNNFYYITQQKTGNVVKATFTIHNEQLRQNLLTVSNWQSFCNYNKLVSELRRQRIKLLPEIGKQWNSLTHIFRHLDASFLLSKGYKRQYCSEMLGHVSFLSLDSYIHKEL